MKFGIRAKFEGDTLIQKSPLDVSWPPYEIRFESDDNGRVKAIAIEVKVEDYKPLLPVLSHPTDESISLTAPANPVHTDLVALLQYFESVGAFWCGVTEIAWDSAEFDWLPESDSEREELAVWDLRIERRYPVETNQIDESYVRTLLHRRARHDWLTVPLAFYREGKNEYRRFRYIQAFVNFYFMIEGLFGGGGRNSRVREQFRASPTLSKAASEAIEYLRTQPKHWDAIRQSLPSDRYKMDANGALDLLVYFRGVLHHFSLKDTRKPGHLHNQREFESLAYLAMAICIKLIPTLLGGETLPSDIAAG